MKTIKHLTTASFLTLVLVLAGCGGGGGGTPPPSGGGSTPVYPRYAYVASNDGTISAYAIDAVSGQLRHRGYFPAGSPSISVALDPMGRYAYAANSGSNDISAYTVSADNGVLTPIDADPMAAGLQNFAAGGSPLHIVVDPTGRFVYVINNTDSNVAAYSINTATGALTEVGARVSTGTNPTVAAIHPSGRFIYVANLDTNNVSVISINTTTGELTAAGTPVSGVFEPSSVAIDPSGRFVYVANSIGGAGGDTLSQFRIDPTTGGLTEIDPPIATGAEPVFVTTDPTGRFVYVVNNASGNVSMFTANSGTGALTSIGAPVATGSSPDEVAVDPSGQFAYVLCRADSSISAYTIDAVTGMLAPTSVAPKVSARSVPVGIAFTHGSAPLTVTPRFAYVPNSFNGANGNTISQYAIDSATGLWSSIGTLNASGLSPNAVAVEPYGRYAFVANYLGNNVSSYSINPATGVLTEISTTPSSPSNPFAVTTDPTGRFVYVANNYIGSNSIGIYSVGGNGDLSSLGTASAGTSPVSIVIDPTGRFAYAANFNSNDVSAYRVDPATGLLDPIDADLITVGIQNFAAGIQPYSATVDPTGRYLYVAILSQVHSSEIRAYSIDWSSGALTDLGSQPGGSRPYSIAISTTGKFAYAANRYGPNVSAFGINLTDGTLGAAIDADPISPGIQHFGASTMAEPTAIVTEPSGRFAYVANWGSNTISAFSADANTGALTEIGTAILTGEDPNSIAIMSTWQ